jgi:hypothetical protein
VTKAAICVHCADIFAPLRDWAKDRSWRWCQCDHSGVRWADGARGLIEVTSMHGPDHIRVLGINNAFLGLAVGNRLADAAAWRALHTLTCAKVQPNYLFHEANRNCWALIVRPGESGDVTFVDWTAARYPKPAEEAA